MQLFYRHVHLEYPPGLEQQASRVLEGIGGKEKWFTVWGYNEAKGSLSSEGKGRVTSR